MARDSKTQFTSMTINSAMTSILSGILCSFDFTGALAIEGRAKAEKHAKAGDSREDESASAPLPYFEPFLVYEDFSQVGDDLRLAFDQLDNELVSKA